MKSAFAIDASEASYLWILEMVRNSGGLAHMMSVQGGIFDAKIKGGAFTLVQRFADRLGDGIALSTPVHTVSQSTDDVRVMTADGEYRARHLVVAVPPALCNTMRFDNTVSPQRLALHQRMPAGATIKFHVAYKDAFWRRSGYTGQAGADELPLGIMMEDALNDGAMLIGSARGKQARELTALPTDARREAVIECLAALFGAPARDVIGYAEKDWAADEWSRGFVGTMAPGVLTQYGAALRAPCGRIHWASSETAMQGNGYMEGALESGERAANEILALA